MIRTNLSNLLKNSIKSREWKQLGIKVFDNNYWIFKSD